MQNESFNSSGFFGCRFQKWRKWQQIILINSLFFKVSENLYFFHHRKQIHSVNHVVRHISDDKVPFCYVYNPNRIEYIKQLYDEIQTFLTEIIKKGASSEHLNDSAKRVLAELPADFENSFIPTMHRLKELDTFYKKTLSRFDKIYNNYRTKSLKRSPARQAIFNAKVDELRRTFRETIPDINLTAIGIKTNFEELLGKYERSYMDLPEIYDHLRDKYRYYLNRSIDAWKAKKAELVSVYNAMGSILECVEFFDEKYFKEFEKQLKATLK